MNADFDARLNEAYLPILNLAQQFKKRQKEVQAGPQTDSTATIIKIEKAKVETIVQVAGELNTLFQDMQKAVEQQEAATEALKARLAPLAEEATTFEQLFFKTVQAAVPDPPDEKAPPEYRRALHAIFRMNHMQTSPETYHATFLE